MGVPSISIAVVMGFVARPHFCELIPLFAERQGRQRAKPARLGVSRPQREKIPTFEGNKPAP
jgi:hypothetical protein